MLFCRVNAQQQFAGLRVKLTASSALTWIQRKCRVGHFK